MSNRLWTKGRFGETLDLPLVGSHDIVIVALMRRQADPIHIRLPGQLYRDYLYGLMMHNQVSEILLYPCDSRHRFKISLKDITVDGWEPIPEFRASLWSRRPGVGWVCIVESDKKRPSESSGLPGKIVKVDGERFICKGVQLTDVGTFIEKGQSFGLIVTEAPKEYPDHGKRQRLPHLGALNGL